MPNDLLKDILAEHLVFVGTPFGTPAEQAQILQTLNKSKIRELPAFQQFLEETYRGVGASPTERVKACLNTLVKFVEDTPQPTPPAEPLDVLTTLKNEVATLQNGINKNAGDLSTLQSQIEEICFCLVHNQDIPLLDRLQILQNMYDPIAKCAPGAQGQVIAQHVYLTANNLLQRLANFAKAALYELNRGTAGQKFDAGPHALNRDLVYAYQNGLKILNMQALARLRDPYGNRHANADIQAALAKEFTVQ